MLFFQLLGPKNLVSFLTSLILSLLTSSLLGSPVSSSFKIYPESNHSHQFHCLHPGPSPLSLSVGSLQMLPAGITVSPHAPVENILSRALVKIDHVTLRPKALQMARRAPPNLHPPPMPIVPCPPSSPFPLSAPALQAPCCPLPDPRGIASLRGFALAHPFAGSALCASLIPSAPQVFASMPPSPRNLPWPFHCRPHLCQHPSTPSPCCILFCCCSLSPTPTGM